MAEAQGALEEASLRKAGFKDPEIEEWRATTSRQLFDAGFSQKEIGEYFGQKEFDPKPIQKAFQDNLAKAETPEGKEFGFLDALEAGWQMSVTGLVTRNQKPDVLMPEDAPMFYRIASQTASLAGDIPAMVAGAMGGGAAGAAAGSAIPVVGTAVGSAVGSGAGAFAAPTFIRESYMQALEKGEVKDFSDFFERASGVFLETAKSAVTGAATAGIGGTVAKVVGPAVASPITKGLTVGASEVATMVTVGKALNGEMPDGQDFLDAAVLVGGLHGSVALASKLRNVYAKTGIKPSQVVQDVEADPVLKQDLLSVNKEIPSPYTELLDKAGVSKEEVAALKEPKPIERPESVKKILSQVGDKEAPKGKPYSFSQFYTDYVDKLDPVNDAVKILTKDPKTLPIEDNPYMLSRMANDFKGKVKYVVENGTLDFKTLSKTGKSLKDIVEPFKQDLPDFEAYLLSKRAIEVEGRGIQSGFDLEAAKDVVKLGGKKYEQAAKDLVEFQNNNLKYLRDSGSISEKSFQAMKEAGQAYIPFRRIIETEEGGKVTGGKGSSLKRLKGSDLKVQSPLISVLENAEFIFKAAERNRAIESLVSLAEKDPAQDLIEKVPTKLRPIEVKADEVNRALKEQGVKTDIDPEAFTIFRAQGKNLSPDEFQVFRDGKREVYKTEKNLAEAIKTLDGDIPATNVFFKLARGITTVKKFGIAVTPDFILRNVFRDQLTAGTFSKAGTIPFTDMVRAMGDLIKKNETYYDWLKSGGGGGGFLELNDAYLKDNVFKLNEQTGLIDKTINIVKKPVEYLRVAAELTEQATRLAEFKRVSKGETSGSKVFEGGFASREVTVDFQRMGAKLSAINAITAFQNVGIQGLDRTIRAIKEDPKGVTAKALAYITVPSVLLWWANKDDPRWSEIPRWQKDLFWIVMTKDTVYRIPKPQELGIMFGSLPERMLEKFFTDNPKALADFEKTMGDLVTPSLVPDAILAPIEHHFNKSTFTGGPVIPHSIENLLPAYQYTEYTSETAKALGKMVATVPPLNSPGSLASPAVLEHYVRAWSGNLGMYFLQVADAALGKAGVVPDPVKPVATLADIPAVKAFVVRFPSAGAQSIVDFYDRFQKNESVEKTVRALVKQGDPEWESVMSNNLERMANLKGIRDSLSNQKRAIELVNKNPNYDSVQQRQIIDGLYYGMIETAKMANKLMDQFEKDMEIQKKELEKIKKQ